MSRHELEDDPVAKEVVRQLTRNVRRRTNRKGFEKTEIGCQWVWDQLWKQGYRCPYTGMPYQMLGGAADPWQPSINRKDNSKGYTKRNCEITSLAYNLALNTWDRDTLLEFAQKLVDNYKQGL